MVNLTTDEADALLDWLETHLIGDIRADEDVDNMEWLTLMVSIYNKCRGVENTNEL